VAKYVSKKPTELLNRIITSSSNENDIVADFYMGNDGLISRVFINYIELENGDEDYNWIMLE